LQCAPNRGPCVRERVSRIVIDVTHYADADANLATNKLAALAVDKSSLVRLGGYMHIRAVYWYGVKAENCGKYSQCGVSIHGVPQPRKHRIKAIFKGGHR
jgi:hypothetical protein